MVVATSTFEDESYGDRHLLSSLSIRNDVLMLPLGRKGMERLDMLLLVIEALDLNASQAMLWSSSSLGLQDVFPNRVELWTRRCHNPLRKSTRRGKLNPSDSYALIILLCTMADRLYPLLHQLLSSKEPKAINTQRWSLLNHRLKELIEERLNTRRCSVRNLLMADNCVPYTKELVKTLSLAAGIGGVERLCASLLDPQP